MALRAAQIRAVDYAPESIDGVPYLECKVVSGQSRFAPVMPFSSPVVREFRTGVEASRVLILRLEPTDYMLALVRALRAVWPGYVDAVFVSPSMTQDWEFDPAEHKANLLPAGTVQSIRKLRGHINATKPLLIHTAGWGAPQSAAAILMCNAQRIPVVVDLDTWRGALSLWRSAAKRLVLPHLFRRITHFAPGGQRQAAYLKRYGVPDEVITPVNMTVDVTAIRAFLTDEPGAGENFRHCHSIATDELVVLFLGRLVRGKGIADLLAAWPAVASEHPRARLIIAGDGEMRDEVMDASDPTVTAVGRLSGDDVWQAYAAADVFVAPSHADSWGLTINEAMAANVPIVMSNEFGCIGDLAHHEKTALVVPARDPAQLANAINRMLHNQSLRDKLTQAASTTIMDWTLELQAQRIANIWRSCLQNTALSADASQAHGALKSSL